MGWHVAYRMLRVMLRISMKINDYQVNFVQMCDGLRPVDEKLNQGHGWD